MRLVPLVIIAAFVAGCGIPHVRLPVNTGVPHRTLRSLSLHADTGFTPAERGWVAMAVKNINEQSAGVLGVTVTYDIDFYSNESFVSHRGDDMLVRAPVDAPYVKYEDIHGGGVTSGVTSVDLTRFSSSVPKHVFLVADRLEAPDAFVHVAMHEILHACGLSHVDDPDAIMSEQYAGTPASVCLGWRDVEELCRVVGCEPRTLSWCE
jgi:hypothetical protein